MTNQWDRFDASAPRSIEDLGFSSNIAVFEPSETEVAGEGFDVSYPNSADGTISGEVTPPESDPNIDPGGTLAEKDVMVYVDDDTGFAFTEYGKSGDASAIIEIAELDNQRYRVEQRNTQYDGYIQLGCVEI